MNRYLLITENELILKNFKNKLQAVLVVRVLMS